jgi:hypothetical protein
MNQWTKIIRKKEAMRIHRYGTGGQKTYETAKEGKKKKSCF